MDPDFWRTCWQERQIFFNQTVPNPLLVEHWRTLGVGEEALVFVPLSGKSLDMRWLRDQGHRILGVELSDIAVREFFAEAELVPRRSIEGRFEVWEAGGYRVLKGDFFDLRKEDLEGVRGVYDRAALVALPPTLRRAYARALAERLPASVSVLLIALELRPSSTQGPPFSVEEREVRELFEPAFDVEVLYRTPFAEAASRERALPERVSVAYAIRR
jgi:thiopurine S-methyltransferase